jgi:hypothetical protein
MRMATMILMEITDLKESGHVGEQAEVQWLVRLAGVFDLWLSLNIA